MKRQGFPAAIRMSAPPPIQTSKPISTGLLYSLQGTKSNPIGLVEWQMRLAYSATKEECYEIHRYSKGQMACFDRYRSSGPCKHFGLAPFRRRLHRPFRFTLLREFFTAFC